MTSTDEQRTARFDVREVRLGYGAEPVIDGLSLEIEPGSFTAIIGPNGCGKSTLLRSLARVLSPRAGAVLLDGERVDALPSRQVARQVGLLPQAQEAPAGITVAELVERGRFPHRGAFAVPSAADREAVASALEVTGLTELAARPVAQLSGGQRQRVWMALVLAQQTETILLDEPTTWLDLAHQVELLDLCARLNETEGRTIVIVLHDLNQAARYAERLVVMRRGAIVAHGAPGDVLTEQLVEDVFGLACRVIPDPETGTPLIVPRMRR